MSWTFNSKETIEQTTITTYDLTLAPTDKDGAPGITFYLDKRENLPNETDLPFSYASVGIYTLSGAPMMIEIIDMRTEATLPPVEELSSLALTAVQTYLSKVMDNVTNQLLSVKHGN